MPDLLLSSDIAHVEVVRLRSPRLRLIGTMIVAARLGHRGAGYLITNEPPGAEYTVNLAAICFVIALLGPGVYSLDRLIF
ncbi:MAG: DoxX family protein [Myxococcota bacterium]|nr:DoxX family protein [Myxococcota bacterium]